MPLTVSAGEGADDAHTSEAVEPADAFIVVNWRVPATVPCSAPTYIVGFSPLGLSKLSNPRAWTVTPEGMLKPVSGLVLVLKWRFHGVIDRLLAGVRLVY